MVLSERSHDPAELMISVPWSQGDNATTWPQIHCNSYSISSRTTSHKATFSMLSYIWMITKQSDINQEPPIHYNTFEVWAISDSSGNSNWISSEIYLREYITSITFKSLLFPVLTKCSWAISDTWNFRYRILAWHPYLLLKFRKWWSF